MISCAKKRTESESTGNEKNERVVFKSYCKVYTFLDDLLLAADRLRPFSPLSLRPVGRSYVRRSPPDPYISHRCVPPVSAVSRLPVLRGLSGPARLRLQYSCHQR